MESYLDLFLNHQQNGLSDQTYFQQVVKSFYYGYNASHLNFIRDSSGLYAAASEKFALLMGVNIGNLLGKTNFELSCNSVREMAEVFLEQDELVKQTGQKKRFLDISTYGENVGVYIFRKSPIINPNTGNVLGIYCVIGEYRARSAVDMLQKARANQAELAICSLQSLNTNFTPREKEVLFCIAHGFIERKLIANFLSHLHRKSIGADTTIKKILTSLYEKTGCISMCSLMKYSTKNKLHKQIPTSLVKATIANQGISLLLH